MGVLKTQSTLTIAVWSSVLLHAASFLGLELVFSNKREFSPESESRTVTILSIGGSQDPIVHLEQESSSDNIPAQIIENFVPDKVVTIKNEPSLMQFEERSFQYFIPGNINSYDTGSNSDQSMNQKISAGDVIGKDISEIKEPVLAETITPIYPFRARKKGQEGIVSLEVVISNTGIPLSCLIINSSGFKDLDDTAVKTVLASLFHPGTVDREETESTLRIRIEFKLNNS